MKSTTRISRDRTHMAIGHKCRSQKVLGFTAMEGVRSNIPGVPYLSHYPDYYSNVSICPVLINHLLGRYSSACNTIENHNRMQKYDLALDKYLVTQSGYFRLATTVALGICIADVKLLFCHGVP